MAVEAVCAVCFFYGNVGDDDLIAPPFLSF